ncbi:Glycosyl transferase family 2 [Pseudobutyrivibrio sp. UC1225]|uniref:glycosyltransferase family 2 protein n=1 Tax=Pseudobutyrivibrio sp. UC1225 TaxID=1798185 RepID=UPI0008F40808|nr:glycosyltransferase [Pseudobutyrivibrio sp. UC1225]SFN78889.1 Glycosyl transferase family 2 [Pseudobutyrivibrio sp. UC1225]
MKEFRVSVLVTFYNQEKYVDRTLQSIINQKTDFGVKIIVGDDGSTDGTCLKVREWIDKFPDQIELYVMDRNPGKQISGFRASRNRLKLLDYVETEYFIFLDGDDYYCYNYKLQKQVEILDDVANKDCIACCHNTDMLYEDGRRVTVTNAKIKERKYGPKEYWQKLYFHTDTLLTRRCVIEKIDKRLLENNFNDNLITFCFLQQGNLYYIPESWTIYFQTGDGIWTSGKEVVNHIRNMFLYDLCNKINPKMKKETDFRFASTWMELLRIRRTINPEDLGLFNVEAIDKKMDNSLKWINYRDIKFSSKLALCLKAVWKSKRKILLHIISDIYGVTLKRFLYERQK